MIILETVKGKNAQKDNKHKNAIQFKESRNISYDKFHVISRKREIESQLSYPAVIITQNNKQPFILKKKKLRLEFRE